MQKFKKILTGLAVHCILSFAILGAVRVYQNGYNKMHYEQLRMASVSVQEQNTQIQILHYDLNFEKISENNILDSGASAENTLWRYLQTEFLPPLDGSAEGG